MFPSHDRDVITFGGKTESNLGKEDQIKNAVGKNVLKLMGKNVTEDFTLEEINQFLKLVRYVEESPSIRGRLMQINDINDYYRIKSEKASRKNMVSKGETVESSSDISGNSGDGTKKGVPNSGNGDKKGVPNF